ncbi:methyl-accepting chemotaxis protein [Halalkalibacter nanhaiisediminis]|uniref:Methyl-accepting chemotaxis protein n=1 Tax=Halalkalibacter nanhaiisediminis TaxID=688079 RepID=A0A562QSD1_9BACI|nr:methyl-accepting chemotaxis protein [Halalkalibacter nanhaiisediminis]TWI59090.1 methyl-accepting chemotaxis protein [Halalkalibacter nanhaiisediminis]
MRLTIRKKLIGSFLLTAFIFGIASFISFANLKSTQESYTYLLDTVSELRSINQEIDSLIGRQTSDLRGYLLYENETFLHDLRFNNSEIQRLIEEAKGLATLQETITRFDDVTVLNESFINEVERVITLVPTDKEQAILMTNQNIVPISRDMRDASSQLKDWLEDILEENEATTIQTSEAALRVVMIVSVLAFVIAIAGGIVVSNTISRPIMKMSALAREVASGNLAAERVNVKSKDEIRDLNQSFNQMTDNLKEILSNIAISSDQVAASSEQLNAGASESVRAADQITESIQSVASGAEKQVESTNTANEIASNISKGMDQIAKNVQSVTESTTLTQQKSKNGLVVIDKTVSQMNEINNKTDQISNVIMSLEGKSKEIGNIISLITAVSDQTNLLSLNAAIEAARAGEHGKGFAVVADEVRKLAVESNDSASKISQLIHDIQQDIQRSVTAMSEGNESVKEGLVYATEAGSEFTAISESISDILKQIEEVSTSIKQISLSTVTMVQSIDEASTIAENASAYSQNVAASAEEQMATMEEISASAETLSRMAEELQATVRKFNL